jgi:hypothetical protein
MKKKITSVIVSLALIVSLTAILTPVASANPDDMVVIYVNVPSDWENPGFWAWGSEGDVFDAWPGDRLEALPDNPGWYYIHVPAWTTGGLVNAPDGDGGNIQTDDFAIEGADLWVTVSGPDDDFEVTDEPQTTGDRPIYVPMFTAYARVPAGWDNPHFWAWGSEGNVFDDWPGEAMTADGDWYKIRIPKWASGLIVNANDGSVQTENIEDWPGEDIWITIEERADDHARANAFFANPDIDDAPMIMIRAVVPATWGDEINLWAWGSRGNLFSGWPGEAMTKVGNWWEIEVEGWADSFIVNGQGGSPQTDDMENVEIGVDVWFIITDASAYEIYYEEPEVPDTPDAPPPPPPPAPAPDPTPAPTPEVTITPEPESNNILWIILGAVGACAVVAVVVVIIKKKK